MFLSTSNLLEKKIKIFFVIKTIYGFDYVCIGLWA